MDFNTAFSIYHDEFQREFGNKKIRKLFNIIDKSKHTRSLLNQCYQLKICPKPKDLRACVLSNLSLSFASKPAGLFCMAILLKKFNDELNIDNRIVEDEVVFHVFENFHLAF